MTESYERKDSIAREVPKLQSDAEPATQKYVTVAVLPYSVLKAPDSARLASGGSTIYAFGTEEAANPNGTFVREPTGGFLSKALKSSRKSSGEDGEPRRKSFLEKAGLVMPKGPARDPEKPPFVLRKVTYETWRKHYAKDKDGNYQGTDTPAEDCLLLPHDLEKWRPGGPTSHRDTYTRGTDALPVYGNIGPEDTLPAYERGSRSPSAEPVLVDENGQMVAKARKEVSGKK